MIGTIVAAGRDRPQWLFVVKVDGGVLYGRTWKVKSQRWTKHCYPFTHAAIGVVEPKAPKPQPPAAWVERPGASPPASGTLQ